MTSESKRVMRPGLRHSFTWSSDLPSFLRRIDETGGWPIGWQYVGFCHTDEREAGWTNSPVNDGWWTVICDVDDYYAWKLSPAALQRIADAVIAAARVTAVDSARLYVRSPHATCMPIGRKSGRE